MYDNNLYLQTFTRIILKNLENIPCFIETIVIFVG